MDYSNTSSDYLDDSVIAAPTSHKKGRAVIRSDSDTTENEDSDCSASNFNLTSVEDSFLETSTFGNEEGISPGQNTPGHAENDNDEDEDVISSENENSILQTPKIEKRHGTSYRDSQESHDSDELEDVSGNSDHSYENVDEEGFHTTMDKNTILQTPKIEKTHGSSYRDSQESHDSDELEDISGNSGNSYEDVNKEEFHTTADIAELQNTANNTENDLEIINNSLDVVELSSEDEVQDKNQPTKTPANIPFPRSAQQFQEVADVNPVIEAIEDPVVEVTEDQYQDQIRKINTAEAELMRAQNAMRVIKMSHLPDKGKSLMNKKESLKIKLQHEREIFKNMVLKKNQPQGAATNKPEVPWGQIEAGVNAIAPRTFGQKGFENFRVEKQMAMEALDSIHKSLEACPTDKDLEEDPKGLKIPLMPHQKRALAWLLWRETQKPSGGILADDMGLGKTLTMISLVIKSLRLELDQDSDKENHSSKKYPGGTLVVCPASLLNQWDGEVQKRTKRGLLSVEVYHGAKRETKPKRLARHDMVITTYALILSDMERSGAIFGVKWRRIILDEAHQIRNYKSKTSEAVFQLAAKSRWALTGTPIHNKELDLYALMKFLRCSPFDDLQVWKRWCGDKSTGGETRLQAVTSSLMLRRTKAELMSNGALQALPERKWELIRVELDKDEMGVYHKVLIFSRTLFAQFLHQRASKDQDAVDLRFNSAPTDSNGEYFKMRNKLLKLNRVKEVSQHEILVLLLRLRQICCHPFLITKMLQGDEDLGNAETEEESDELNLLEQLSKLDINEADDQNSAAGLSEEACGLKEQISKGYLNPTNPVFMQDRRSSKIKILLKLIKEKVVAGDKAIIVSQWTKLLELVAMHLKAERIIYDSLDGSIPVHKRMPIVDAINDPNSNTKVLLLSLTAGGVGLNLVGANHLFLLDLHWNPQLENQAQDRIYRMGQTKPIFVYKFMASETIEERIKMLQDRKLDIAESVFTGSKKVSSSKLTLQDLKLLFEFK